MHVAECWAFNLNLEKKIYSRYNEDKLWRKTTVKMWRSLRWISLNIYIFITNFLKFSVCLICSLNLEIDSWLLKRLSAEYHARIGSLLSRHSWTCTFCSLLARLTFTQLQKLAPFNIKNLNIARVIYVALLFATEWSEMKLFYFCFNFIYEVFSCWLFAYS